MEQLIIKRSKEQGNKIEQKKTIKIIEKLREQARNKQISEDEKILKENKEEIVIIICLKKKNKD